MLLSKLTKTINIDKTYNFKKNNHFSSLTSNSKLTNKKTIFIIDKNLNSKKDYINEALKNKIPAIISNKYFDFVKIPQFIVSDIEKETELILKNINKYLPFKSIAVTGTNGKTSVVWYISKILFNLKFSNKTLGTIGYYKNCKKLEDITLTTPAYEELYKYASSNKYEKNIFIFEASSHALDQNRLRNFPINISAITNISNDHLDYHKSIFQYKKTKFKLFTKYLSENGFAVINSRIKNISNLKKIISNKKIKIIYYGKKDIFFEKKNNFFTLNIFKHKYDILNLKLTSEIELENLECAVACCVALKIKHKLIVRSLKNITNPPGRLQLVNYKKKKAKIIIDYAHTPDALEKILKSFIINNKKPSLLFGCGGERDKEKRKKMGIIANKLANKIYITDDNPRNENASKIRKEILKFCPSGIEIASRKKAIIKAMRDLSSNQILIIAGKGHERTQIINKKKLYFNDYEIVKNIIKK